MTSYIVTEIEVTFSKGSFEEWANNVDVQDPDYVAECETAYNAEITAALKNVYPHAAVTVKEGYDFLASTKIYYNYEVTDAAESDYDVKEGDEWKIDDEIKTVIHGEIGRVSDAGNFWK